MRDRAGVILRDQKSPLCKPKNLQNLWRNQIGPWEGSLRVRTFMERSPMAKAATGPPVAVGLSHPKGSSPFPLRHFL